MKLTSSDDRKAYTLHRMMLNSASEYKLKRVGIKKTARGSEQYYKMGSGRHLI